MRCSRGRLRNGCAPAIRSTRLPASRLVSSRRRHPRSRPKSPTCRTSIAIEIESTTRSMRLWRRAVSPMPISRWRPSSRPLLQADIDQFVAGGGTIRHVFRSISYGWIGKMKRSAVPAMAASLGNDLLVIAGDLPIGLHLDKATRTGRVRPVWVNGFAQSVGGFSGAGTTTVAIVDTGVDITHSRSRRSPRFLGRSHRRVRDCHRSGRTRHRTWRAS